MTQAVDGHRARRRQRGFGNIVADALAGPRVPVTHAAMNRLAPLAIGGRT